MAKPFDITLYDQMERGVVTLPQDHSFTRPAVRLWGSHNMDPVTFMWSHSEGRFIEVNTTTDALLHFEPSQPEGHAETDS